MLFLLRRNYLAEKTGIEGSLCSFDPVAPNPSNFETGFTFFFEREGEMEDDQSHSVSANGKKKKKSDGW